MVNQQRRQAESTRVMTNVLARLVDEWKAANQRPEQLRRHRVTEDMLKGSPITDANLAGVPFSDKKVAEEFFKDPKKVGALIEYVTSYTVWDPSHMPNYAREVLHLVCKSGFRRKHFWRGKKL